MYLQKWLCCCNHPVFRRPENCPEMKPCPRICQCAKPRIPEPLWKNATAHSCTIASYKTSRWCFMMDFLWSVKQSPFRFSVNDGWMIPLKAFSYLIRTAGIRNKPLKMNLLWFTLLKCLHLSWWILAIALNTGLHSCLRIPVRAEGKDMSQACVDS